MFSGKRRRCAAAIGVVFLAVMAGCVTAPTGGSARSATPRSPYAAVDASVSARPDAQFVVQILKADLPACFSPDGRFLVTRGIQADIQMWETDTGRLVRSFPPDPRLLKDISYDPEGRYLLVQNLSDLRLVDVRTGESVRPVDVKHAGMHLISAAFSPDGRYLLVNRQQKPPVLEAVATGKAVHTFAKIGPYHPVAMTADGRRLVTIDSKRVRVFGVPDGRLIHQQTIRGGIGEIGFQATAVRPDGGLFAHSYSSLGPPHHAIPRGYYIELIRTDTGRVRRVTTGTANTDLPLKLAFTADGRNLVVTFNGGRTALLDPGTGRLRQSFESHAAAVSPVGSVVAIRRSSMDEHAKGIVLFDYRSKKEVGRINGIQHHGMPFLSFIGPDRLSVGGNGIDVPRGMVRPEIQDDGYLQKRTRNGKRAVVTDNTGARSRLVDLATGRTVRELPSQQQGMAGGGGGYFLWDLDDAGTMALYTSGLGWRLLDVTTDTGLETVSDIPVSKDNWGQGGQMPRLSPDGNTVVHTMHNHMTSKSRVYAWNTRTLKRSAVLEMSKSNGIQAMAFSEDSRYLAVAVWHVHTTVDGVWFIGYDNYRTYADVRIEIWDVAAQRRRRIIENVGDQLTSLAFTPDGTHLAAAGSSGKVVLYHINSKRPIATYRHPARIEGVAISPDGRRLATSGMGTAVWDLHSGKSLFSMVTLLDPGAGHLKYLTWTADGYYRGDDGLAKQFCHLVVGMKAYPLDRFFDRFYNPAVIEARVAGRPTDVMNIVDILSGSPPPVVSVSHRLDRKNGRATITVNAKDSGGGVREIRLFHNGKRVGERAWSAVRAVSLDSSGGIRDRSLQVTDLSGKAAPVLPSQSAIPRGDKSESFTVALLNGENQFRASALSQEMVESEPRRLILAHTGKDRRPVLHLVAAGIHQYQEPISKLPASRADAEAFVQELTGKARKLFRNYRAVALYDTDATRNGIFSALAKVQRKAKPEDTMVFFFSGHGLVHPADGRFYLVAQGVNNLTQPNGPGAIQDEGVSDLMLGSALQKIPAIKQVVFLDACQSGGASFGDAFNRSGEEIAVKRVGRATGIWAFSASSKSQFAYETAGLGHGVFTYALLNAMSGEADRAGDGAVDLSDLADFLPQAVAKVAKKIGVDQAPTIQRGMADFPLVKLR